MASRLTGVWILIGWLHLMIRLIRWLANGDGLKRLCSLWVLSTAYLLPPWQWHYHRPPPPWCPAFHCWTPPCRPWTIAGWVLGYPTLSPKVIFRFIIKENSCEIVFILINRNQISFILRVFYLIGYKFKYHA